MVANGTEPLLFAECSVCSVCGSTASRGGIVNRRRWVPDAAGNEAQARNRKGHCASNLSLRRKLALNLAPLESRQGSMRGKVKRTGCDDGFLINILSQFTKIHMR